ncbi:MAG: hypothetical protein KC519_05090 [Anaerolineae bacterium]|nr:hypothetical protein [Anaerolineae bacterium]
MVASSFSDDDARKIEDLRAKLARIRLHDGNPDWFGSHESSIRDTVLRAIAKGPVYQEAVNTLFVCLENLRDHKTYPEWAVVVSEALLVASTLGNTHLQARLYLAYGDFMLREGHPKMASRAAEICFEMLSDSSTVDDDERRTRAALLLICAQQPLSDRATTQRLIDQVFRFAEQANKPHLTAHVYQILSHIYLYQGDLDVAIDYAQRGKDLWTKLNYQLGIIDCLLNQARVARKQGRFDQVDFLLNQIQLDPNSFNGHKQYVNHMYEMGALRLETGNLAQAEATLYQLVEYLKTVDSPRELAIARHTLALSQIAQNHFAEADENLTSVSKTWSNLRYTYGQADVYVARGYFERQRGRRFQAMQWLDEAEKLCGQIENDALRKQMLDTINIERSAWDQ